MKIRNGISVIMVVLLMSFAACGSREESFGQLPTMAPTNTPTPTASPVPMVTPTCTPVPTRTPIQASTPTPTCSPAPTSTPVPTPIPEDYGDELFVFDREYTDEWGWIEVCFWLKDKDGNPLPGEWCELLVDEDFVMIKSPMVVDYYDTRQDAVTDEEGKVEFIIIDHWEEGDRELNLTITTHNSRHTEKIYCVDPVRTVPSLPELTVEQAESYIKLSWEWDYDAKQYCVERRVNDGEYEPVMAHVTFYSTWYVDDDVTPGNIYYYRVYGKNHVGNGKMCEVSVNCKIPLE